MQFFKVFITIFAFISCNSFFITGATEIADPKKILEESIENFLRDYENEYLPQDFSKTIAARPKDMSSLKACEVKFKTDAGMEGLETIFNNYEKVFEETLTETEKQIYRNKLTQIVSKHVKKQKLVKTLLKENRKSNHVPAHNLHKFTQREIDEFNESIKDGIETALPKCGYCLKTQGLKKECEDNGKVKKNSLCAGCEKIFYCSEECQMLHWPIHKQHCKSGKNNSSNLTDNSGLDHEDTESVESIKIFETRKCAGPECQKNENLKKCSRCENVSYCSKECQRSHWPTHKPDCKKKTTADSADNKENSNSGDSTAEEVD